MSIERLLVDDFRNLQGVEPELGPRFNLFIGRNGAGKTAVLESAFYLVGLGLSGRVLFPILLGMVRPASCWKDS